MYIYIYKCTCIYMCVYIAAKLSGFVYGGSVGISSEKNPENACIHIHMYVYICVYILQQNSVGSFTGVELVYQVNEPVCMSVYMYIFTCIYVYIYCSKTQWVRLRGLSRCIK